MRTRFGGRMRTSYAVLAGSSAIEAPRRRKRLSVASSSSIKATTMSPVSAASLRLRSAMSPSRMPASIIESPRTSSAKCSPGLNKSGGMLMTWLRVWIASIGVPAVVRGGGTHPAVISFNDAWGETAGAVRRHAMGNRFGKLDHLNGASPVRQAADKAALLKRRDQPVNAGFGAKVERILHLVKGGRNPGLLESLMDKTQELSLLACEHRRSLSGCLNYRNKS